MPTVQQLPLAVAVNPTDQIPIEQDGQTMSVAVSTLTAGTQPKLTLATGALLGRSSIGPGAPEPIGVGAGLMFSGGQLHADTSLIAPLASPAFSGAPTAPTPAAGDASNALATTAFVAAATGGGSAVPAGTIVLTGDVVGAGTSTIATSLATIIAPGVFTKVTVNGKGQVVAGASLTTADLGDGSLLPVTATGTTLARNLGTRSSDVLNVLDYGAVGDGVTRSGAAIGAAIAAAAARTTGGEVYIPAGNYRIDVSQAGIFAKSSVILRGAGRGKTVLFIDDANGQAGTNGGNAGITNATPGAVYPTITDFHLRGITLQGTRGQSGANVTQGVFLVNLVNIRNISVVDCEFLDSRGFSLGLFTGSDVLVRGNRVLRSNVNSIAVWDVSNVIITDNEIAMSGDNSISVHSGDSTAAPVRAGIVISNNSITDGQGIHVLGAKSAVISNNVIRRSRPYGINIGYDAFFAQGNTPNFGVQIINNVIEDISDGSIYNSSANGYYIFVGGSSKQAGAGASAPGAPVAGTGSVTPLFGTVTGSFYANAQSNTDGQFSVTGTTPSPGGHWLRIEGNTLVRTLPAVATWSAWGYGSTLQVGKHGVYNGAVTEAMLAHPGIHIQPALRNCRIAGNIIQTTGANGIEFDAVANSMDYDGVEICGNRIADFSAYGIAWAGAAATTQRIRIAANDFDGDPYFRSVGRGAGGTWTAAGTGSIGLNLSLLSGVELTGNHFRNVVAVTVQGAGVSNVLLGNVVHCNPVAVGFNAANSGVGTLPAAAADFSHVIEVGDPADANYGKIKSPTLFSAPAQPAAGTYVTGHFVASTAPILASGQLFLGWKRLTTGSAHVGGTDWAPVYGGNATPPLPQPAVTTTYTASGAIAPTDNLALVNTAAAVSMSLAASTSDGHQLIVKRYGAGALTLTTTLDGVAGTAVVMNSASLKEAITLAWNSAAATWLML